MKKENYVGAATSVYLNYAVVGVATIFISQYRDFFIKAWNTTAAGLSMVLAGVGLGRILTILLAGAVSDKIGRKKTLLIALVCDILFLLGAAFAKNIWVASIAALFFGATNSFGDTAGYPALADAFPNKTATMNSLVKAAMQIMQLIFPFWVAAFPDPHITAIALIIIIAIDVFTTLKAVFAPQEESKPKNNLNLATSKSQNGSQPSLAVDGVMIIALGFTLCFTFYIFSLYVPFFGSVVLHQNPATANQLISWYSAASLISVFITSALVTKVKRLYLILLYSTISTLGLLFMVLMPSLISARLGAIAVGFFAAGGVWQVGLSVLTSYFPTGHGKFTSYYSFMAAICYFVAPLVASFVIKNTVTSVLAVFWITTIITAISVILVLLLLQRSKKFN